MEAHALSLSVYLDYLLAGCSLDMLAAVVVTTSTYEANFR